MFDQILNIFGGGEEEVGLESFTELKQKVTNLISEEVAQCSNYPELGQHVVKLGSIIAGIEEVSDEDMEKLFGKIKEIPALPDNTPVVRSTDLTELISSI